MGKFRLLIDDPEYAEAEVDTSATVALWATRRELKPLWKVLRNRALTALAVFGIVCFHLAFTGRIPESAIPIGWLAALAFPAMLGCVLYSNTNIIRYILGTFLFWAMLAVSVVFLACGADMVAYAPHRVFALVVYWLSNVCLLLFDARMLGTHKVYSYRWGAMSMCLANGLCGAVVGVLYLFGAVSVQNTPVLLMGANTLPIGTVGMCMYLCLVTFQLRCAWVVWTSPRPNPMVMLFAPISFVDATPPSFSPRASMQSMHEGGLSRPPSFQQQQPYSTGLPRAMSRPSSMHIGGGMGRFLDKQPMSPIGEESPIGRGKMIIPANLPATTRAVVEV